MGAAPTPTDILILDGFTNGGLADALTRRLQLCGIGAKSVTLPVSTDPAVMRDAIDKADIPNRHELCIITDGGAPGSVKSEARIWDISPGTFGRGWVTVEASRPMPSARDLLQAPPTGPLPDLPSVAPHRPPSQQRKRRRLDFSLLWSRNGSGQLRDPDTGPDHVTLVLPDPMGSLRETEHFLRHVISTASGSTAVETHLLVRLSQDSHKPEWWKGALSRVLRRSGMDNYVTFRSGGDLRRLVAEASTVVTACGAGLTATLLERRPVHATGPAPALPGLTHSGRMADFWRSSFAPDPALADAALKALAERQVEGDLSNATDYDALAARISARILAQSETGTGADEHPEPEPMSYPVAKSA